MQFLVGIVLVCWGVAGIFDKKAVERAGSLSTFLTFHLFNVPAFIILLFILPLLNGPIHFNKMVLFWEVLNSVCALAALLTYYYAMRVTQASWVLGITAAYPLIGLLIAWFGLGEAFSVLALIAALAVSFGVGVIGFSGRGEQQNLSTRARITLFAWVACSTVLWGVLGIYDKQAVQYAHPLEVYLVFSGMKAALSLVAVAFFARGQVVQDMKTFRLWKFSWLSAACVEAGNIAFLLAVATASAGYLIVATACYPLIMYVCAIFFLGERVNVLRAIGIALIIGGLVLTNVAGG